MNIESRNSQQQHFMRYSVIRHYPVQDVWEERIQTLHASRLNTPF